MKIIDLLKTKRCAFPASCFHLKQVQELQNALNIVSDIAEVGSAVFIECYVWGPAGTSCGVRRWLVARAIEASGRPALAHLTCIDADEAKIDGVLAQMRAVGVQNVLALRGDAVNGNDGDFAHASDLMGKIKKAGDFCVGGACYPEGHPEAGSLDRDIVNTRRKIDSGCDFLVTQMVFDNNIIYNYMYRLLRHGIDVPVVAGIMPVTNAKQINRICELSGTKLPANYRAIVEKFADDPEALKQAGIAYATGQIVDLIANGLKNIHVYTMNRPEIIGGIMKNLSEIVK